MPQLQDELCSLGVDCLYDGLPCLYLLLGVDAWRLRVPAIAFSHKSHPRPHVIFRIKLTFELQKPPPAHKHCRAMYWFQIAWCQAAFVSRPLHPYSTRQRPLVGPLSALFLIMEMR